jgi:hypothetical protein
VPPDETDPTISSSVFVAVGLTRPLGQVSKWIGCSAVQAVYRFKFDMVQISIPDRNPAAISGPLRIKRHFASFFQLQPTQMFLEELNKPR